LEKTLDSVTQQNWQDMEIIVADDASKDGAAMVVETFQRRDSRIRFCEHPRNLGLTANWNWCLREARGQAIKLMGGDDLLKERDCLSLQWAALQKPGLALVSSARQLIDETGWPIRIESTLSPGLHAGASARNRMLETQMNLVGEPVCALFWRNLSSRGFDPAYQQLTDVEFWFHLLSQGDLLYQHEPLVSFRIHPRQQSQQNWSSGLSLEEHFRLLLQEANKPYCSTRARQAMALWTWGMLRHLPESSSLNLMKSMQRLRSQLGYVQFWLVATGHLFRKVATRWGRSIRKRLGQLNT
jgi:glycosyltransferase involved in cell wall biosynthesis